MALVIVGLGAVGLQIKNFCDQAQLPVKAIVAPRHPLATHRSLGELFLDEQDTIIDFSTPEATLEHVEYAGAHKKNIVMGTTRWEKNEESIKNIVQQSGIGFAHTPNFLPEAHAFWEAVAQTAKNLSANPSDILRVEIQEVRLLSKSSFSGTALKTAAILQKHPLLGFRIEEDLTIQINGEDPIDIRVTFTAPHGSITHRIHSLDVHQNDQKYAEMAVRTALWLTGKKGYFELTSDDIQKVSAQPLLKASAGRGF